MSTIYDKYYILKSLIIFEKEFKNIEQRSVSDAGIMDDDVIKYYVEEHKNNYKKYLNILNDKYNISKETLDKILKEEKIRKTSFMQHENVIHFLKTIKSNNEKNKKKLEISKLKNKNLKKFYKKIKIIDFIAMSKIKNLIKLEDLKAIEENNSHLLQNDLLSNFIKNDQLEEFLFIYRKNANTISDSLFVETLFIDIQFKDELFFLKKIAEVLNEKEKLMVIKEINNIYQLKEYEDGSILRNMVIATIEKSLINQSFDYNNDNVMVKNNKKRM